MVDRPLGVVGRVEAWVSVSFLDGADALATSTDGVAYVAPDDG